MGIRRAELAILLTAVLGLSSAYAADDAACPRPGTLGVSRTVEIDTTGGPGFGMEHYKAYDFLQDKEVILTFDDGPQKYTTEAVLKALNDECVKATFFSIGKMALGYPEIIREVAKSGNTIGTHTWSHKALAKVKTFDDAKDEIERGVSAVHRAVGGNVASFFRFPTLVDTPETVAYLGKRNIAIFSTDIDSFDFKPQTADHLVKSLMQKLDKRGKGIILMHDIHKTTAKAVPMLLAELKAKGYKIVHMTSKAPVTTVAEYDQAIEKEAKGLPQVGAERPVSSIVKTIEGPPAADEATSTATGEPEGMPAASAPEQPAANPAASSLPSFPSSPKSTAPSAAPGKQSSIEPVTSTPPDASKALAAAASPEPAPPAVPVTSVATVDTSPVKTVSGAAASVTEKPAMAPVKTIDVASSSHPAEPPKSISEKLKETWKFWFGE